MSGKRLGLVIAALTAGILGLEYGDTNSASSAIVGYDGKPVVCPDGTPLGVGMTPISEPSYAEARASVPDLPPDKRPVFNEYTGRFEAVAAATETSMFGSTNVAEPLVYTCGPKNEPRLQLLSKVDPHAAKTWHDQAAPQIQNAARLSGLSADAVSDTPR